MLAGTSTRRANDGSDESRRALDAAVALAEAAGATLRIISVFQWLSFGATTAGALPGERFG